MDMHGYQEWVQGVVFAPDLPYDAPLYAALGISGECGELIEACDQGDRDGVIGELGDVLWYTARICGQCGLSMQELAMERFLFGPTSEPEQLLTLVRHALAAVEITKKWIRDGELPETRVKLGITLGAVVVGVAAMATTMGTSLAGVIDANVDKIMYRREHGKGHHVLKPKMREGS